MTTKIGWHPKLEDPVSNLPLTPREAGYRMPAEWTPHSATLMIWPARKRMWGERYDDACREYAGVASAIAAFEPVYMVCNPGEGATVRRLCGEGVTPLEFGADDSWARDCGPTFVTDDAGNAAAVKFAFNAWGNRWHPYDQDALVPERIAEHFGVPVFTAPLVLEGGSFFVDGEGTLLTTEQCLLHPNRNPHLSREQIEQKLRDYLGVDTVIWLPFGHSLDTGPTGTDGHVDGVAQFVAPGRVFLEVPESTASDEYSRSGESPGVGAGDGCRRSHPAHRAIRSSVGRADLVCEPLSRQRRGDRAGRYREQGRRVAGCDPCDLPRPRGRRCAGGCGGHGRRRPALHHPADPRRHRLTPPPPPLSLSLPLSAETPVYR